MVRILLAGVVLALLVWLGLHVATSKPPVPSLGQSPGTAPPPSYAREELELLFNQLTSWSTLAANVNQDLDRAVKESGGEERHLPLSMLELHPSAPAYQVGQDLAATRCTVCHLAVSPGDLPRDAWSELFHIKRLMFSASGILASTVPAETYRIYKRLTAGRKGLWDPPVPTFSLPATEFAALVYYHVSAAKDETVARLRGSTTRAPFQSSTPGDSPWQIGGFLASAILDDGRILLGRAMEPALIVADAAGVAHSVFELPGVPTGIVRGPDGLHYVTLIAGDMSTMLFPNQGKLIRLRYHEGRFHDPEIIAAGLNRPIRVHFADLDGDDEAEMLLLEFGWLSGGLRTYKHDRVTGKWTDNGLLVDASGVVGVAAQDLNGNGLIDLVVLIAQAEQTLNVMHNLGGGKFKREVLVQKPPGFGFNSLVLADMTGNGLSDIVTTNGDNFDLKTQPLKGQHGIRLFANDGAGGFPERFFYPLYGAVQTHAGDFNGDGRNGIAAISLFPAIGNPESFVYLKPDGQGGFSPSHLASDPGHAWVTMTVGRLKGKRASAVILTAYIGMSNRPSGLDSGWVTILEPAATD